MIEAWINRMTSVVQDPWTIRTLRNSLFLITAYLILVLSLPLHDLFWGEDALTPQLGFADGPINYLILFLHQPGNESWYPLFFVSVLAGLSLYLLKGYPRLSTFLIWLGVVVLYFRAYLSMVGGNYLLHSLLFYLIFADEKATGESIWGSVSVTLTNLSLLACRIQVLIVYIFSSGYKWVSAQWRSGEAVYDILHIKEFSLPWIMETIDLWHGLAVFMNYFALAYFTLFSVLVWSKRWKLPLLFIGLCIHLGMGWAIGVMDFSLIMIASYTAFLEKDDIDRVKSMFTKRIKA
jgi:hypothetical protein